MINYKNREEVPEKYKWDLSDFFKSEEEFDESVKAIQKQTNELQKYKGLIGEAGKMLEYLSIETKTISLWENAYVYSFLMNDQELGNKKSIERKSKTKELLNNIRISTSFFEPELLKMDENEYNSLFEKEPKLKDYKYNLDKIFRNKDHTLNEEEEKIVSMLTGSVNNFSDMSSTLVSGEHDYGCVTLKDGTKTNISTSNYNVLMKNKDVNIRKKVYKKFNKVLNNYGSTSASILNNYISLNNSVAKIHKHKNAWEAKLFDIELTDKVFETLISAVEKNTDTFRKYFELKKKVLGLDKMHFYDTALEMTDTTKEYTIEEAQELIRKSLEVLGSEYLSHFDKIITNRYIDYCGYKGKASGGYSFGTSTISSRILMSYNYDLSSVSTIAHEAGHNVHHQFINENNLIQNRDIRNLEAEVISLTNEILLSDYLAKNGKTKEEKLSGINNIMKVIISNLYGAVREGKLELEMYEHVDKNNILTKEYLDNLVKKSLKKYYKDTVVFDKYNNSWITRNHYFMNFYLFSYAICISVAINVANKIINKDKEMISKYYKYMKSGSNKTPMESFKILGINLEDKNVYENACNYLDTLIDKFNEISTEEK